MMASLPHITVCICTFKRPQLLQRLLRELDLQETQGRFTYSIVVVDNDRLESAKPILLDFAAASSIQTTYCVEPKQNIALARNKALEHASGDFVAFFDDDQFPVKDWLHTLFRACDKYGADGVLGPVKPFFEVAPPKWVVKGRFCERPTYPTGFVIDWRKGRTGNVLLKRHLFAGDEQPFRPEFLTGEDQDFFRRMIEKGHVFVWCNEAVAYEIVPPLRWQRSFMLKRALLRGKISLVHPTSGPLEVTKSVIAVPAYGLALPFLLLMGQHMFMKYLVKAFDHAGRILAFVGVDAIKETYITE
jgi:cellulose synthase/poly-beta-1,6-N-acetylglucosamine synthase-like glycosyltransferase